MTTSNIFKPGEKVSYKGKTYDFGYMSNKNTAVLYEEGECNMQDAIAVEAELVIRHEPIGMRQNESTTVASLYISYASWGSLQGSRFEVRDDAIIIRQALPGEEEDKYVVLKKDVSTELWKKMCDVAAVRGND